MKKIIMTLVLAASMTSCLMLPLDDDYNQSGQRRPLKQQIEKVSPRENRNNRRPQRQTEEMPQNSRGQERQEQNIQNRQPVQQNQQGQNDRQQMQQQKQQGQNNRQPMQQQNQKNQQGNCVVIPGQQGNGCSR